MGAQKSRSYKLPFIAQSNLDQAIKRWDVKAFARILLIMPILEEILFRGPVLLAGIFGSGVQFLVAGVSLVWFVARHRSQHKNDAEAQKAVTAYLILGIACTTSVMWYPWWEGIWYAMAFHFIWNLIGVGRKLVKLHLGV